MIYLPTTRSRRYVNYKWSQQFGAKKLDSRCGLSVPGTFYHFIAEHCVGRYKFVWALLRKYPGIFSGLLVQHFVKRRPFKQSANQV